MEDKAVNQISELKLRFEAETDEDLAKSLGIGRSTIASWRRRDSVPERYILRQPGEDKSVVSAAPIHWSEEEQVAFRLALLRSSIDGIPKFESYQDFIKNSGKEAARFMLVFNEAKKDVIERMNAYPDMSASNAASLLAYEEFHPSSSD